MSTSTSLIATATALLAALVLVDGALPPGAMSASRRAAGGQLVVAAAAALAAVAGCVTLSGDTVHVDLTWLLGDLGGDLVLDHLAGLFLLIVCGVTVPACLVSASWAMRADPAPGRGLGSATALTVLACIAVILAGNVFVLVLGWELLTAGFYWLAGHRRRDPGQARASVVAAVFGKASGGLLLIGLLLLAGPAQTLDLDALGQTTGPVRTAGYALLIAAFAVKVGLVPVQVWMPTAYSAAPGPVRAVMAGAAVNVGFYGLWRTFAILGAPPTWLIDIVLLTAAFTALLGIAHATVQRRLTRVVAYSSVENAGLIVTAWAVALIGARHSDEKLVAAGLLAATLQVVAHALAKTLLFASAGTIESQLGTDDLEKLRGVARQLPWSGTGLAIGAFTLAALPVTVAFVSEWFILETLMQQFRLQDLASTLPMAAAGALVALTAGFAGVAFTRLAAFTALGPTHVRNRGRDVGPVGAVGLGLLAAGCVLLAALTPLEIRVLATGLDQLVPAETTRAAVASPWVLGPVYRDFSVLSPSWLSIVLPTLLVLVTAVAIALSKGGLLRVRRVPAWRSATGGVDGADEYTPFGYANPTRKVLANVLLTKTELQLVEARDGGSGEEAEGPVPEHLDYTSDVVELVETFLYRPLERPVRMLVRVARRLQSGRLDAYLAYMLIALVALIAVVTGVG